MGRQHQQPHILMLPFPLLVHIKPMLNIAQLLCHAGLQVTFLNTEHNHQRLTQLQELSTHFPTLHFESISDGLPKDHPRTFYLTKDMVISFKSVTKPLFREMLAEYSRNSDLGPVTCVIVDGIMYSFANDVAEELGIRVITTRPYGACCLGSFCCISKLIEEGHISVGGEYKFYKF
ncbi:7-deoxyloganetic acid glucosyltransferase [Quercus suber]|uniref:7-deoxyloganetic acid glucosyltransferase n=1 Tax=Quercus suber TaxID=58331 RepID=A0AAW0L2U3_QUESU